MIDDISNNILRILENIDKFTVCVTLDNNHDEQVLEKFCWDNFGANYEKWGHVKHTRHWLFENEEFASQFALCWG